MADIDRPNNPMGSKAESQNDSVVNGFAVTPVEGLDTTAVPKIPMAPSEVLELLKARLALDVKDIAELGRLANAPSYEAAQTSTRTWPPKDGVPSSPDITPSPVVIGIDEIEAMAAESMAEMSSNEHPAEPDQRNTPAEPVASVRVRRVESTSAAVEQAAMELRAARADRDTNPALHLGSIAGRLYFPPMKPPESWQGGQANEPLVQIVPDCDARMRTARGLRRPSNWPTPSYLLELRKQRSLVVISVGAVFLVLGVAFFSARWNRTPSTPRRPAAAAHQLPSAAPSLSAPIDAGEAAPAVHTAPSSSTDVSTTPVNRRGEPPVLRRQPKSGGTSPKTTSGPVAPGEDKLVF